MAEYLLDLWTCKVNVSLLFQYTQRTYCQQSVPQRAQTRVGKLHFLDHIWTIRHPISDISQWICRGHCRLFPDQVSDSWRNICGNYELAKLMFFSCFNIRSVITVSSLSLSALRQGWASCLSWIIFERSDNQSPRSFHGSVEDAVDFLLTKFQIHEGIFVWIMNLQI